VHERINGQVYGCMAGRLDGWLASWMTDRLANGQTLYLVGHLISFQFLLLRKEASKKQNFD
jgi:hypothetical protein